MTIRFLATAVVAAILATHAFGAAPKVTVNAKTFTIATAPGATVAYYYSVGGSMRLHRAGVETDTDGDGSLTVDVAAIHGSTYYPWYLLAVDLATGDYAAGGIETPPGFPERPILPGPTGAMSELVLPGEYAVSFWVRPRSGAWMPPAGYFLDKDGANDPTGFTIGSVSSFVPAGSSPATPAGFARGDLFFILMTGGLRGGLVDPILDFQNSPGAISFASEMTRGKGSEYDPGYYIPLVRTGGSAGTVSVRCCTASGGAAKPGVDFLPIDEVVTFGPGELTKRIESRVIDDAIWSGTRSFGLEMHSPTGGAVLAQPTKIWATIFDNDPPPTIDFGTVPETIPEGDETRQVRLPVTITGARSVPVTVSYEWFAYGQGRFKGELVLQPGDAGGDALITVLGDTVPEPDYEIQVDLRVGAFGSTRRRSIKVIDDDLPTIDLTDAVAQEGKPAKLTFKLSSWDTSTTPSLTWRTVDGTAKAGVDYVAASGAFASGDIRLELLPDAAREGDEYLFVEMVGASNVVPVRSRAMVTIIDDDVLPAPVFSELQAVEGDKGQWSSPTVRLTLSSTPAPIPIIYRVVATPITATFQADYMASGDVTFQPGQRVAEMTVEIAGDDIAEGDETFELRIADTESRAIFTILDDDEGEMPAASIEDLTVTETTGSDASPMIRIRLSAASKTPVSVGYETRSGTALEQSDFFHASGTASFAAGATLSENPIRIVGDGITEPTERFEVVLSNPSGVTIQRGTAIVTILDDDQGDRPLPRITAGDATLVEGTGGRKTMLFPVTLSAPSPSEVRVSYATADDTALAGSDYVAVSGVVTIPAGITQVHLQVEILSDSAKEPSERLRLTLSSPQGATITRATAHGTIEDDDEAPGKGRAVRH